MNEFPRLYDASTYSPAFKFQNLDRVCIGIVLIVGLSIAMVACCVFGSRKPARMTAAQELAVTRYELEMEQERSEALMILLKQLAGSDDESDEGKGIP